MRGGKRPGAGRPLGSTTAEPTKTIAVRLKPDELRALLAVDKSPSKAVRKLLAERASAAAKPPR